MLCALYFGRMKKLTVYRVAYILLAFVALCHIVGWMAVNDPKQASQIWHEHWEIIIGLLALVSAIELKIL